MAVTVGTYDMFNLLDLGLSLGRDKLFDELTLDMRIMNQAEWNINHLQ